MAVNDRSVLVETVLAEPEPTMPETSYRLAERSERGLRSGSSLLSIAWKLLCDLGG